MAWPSEEEPFRETFRFEDNDGRMVVDGKAYWPHCLTLRISLPTALRLFSLISEEMIRRLERPGDPSAYGTLEFPFVGTLEKEEDDGADAALKWYGVI